MKIKIDEKNADKIEKALKSVNGRASEHAYTSSHDIISIAVQAERKVLSLLPKKSASGACYSATSGQAVAKAYKWRRNGTKIVLCRGSKDWFLVDIWSVTLFEDGGSERLLLTDKQSAEAIERFKSKNYSTI